MYTSYYLYFRSCHTDARYILHTACAEYIHEVTIKRPLHTCAGTTRCLILTLDAHLLCHSLSKVCVVHIACTPCMCFRSLCIREEEGWLWKGIKLLVQSTEYRVWSTDTKYSVVYNFLTMSLYIAETSQRAAIPVHTLCFRGILLRSTS